MSEVTVLGAGTWGLALAVLLHNNGHHVTVWSALPAEIDALNRDHTQKNLPGAVFSEEICFTADEEEALKAPELIVMSVASVYVRQTARRLAHLIRPGQLIVNVSKGIEESTLKLLDEQIREEIPQAVVAVLSGPTHAEEVSVGMPTTCVVGAADKETADYVRDFFMSDVFRVYTNTDVLGIELGGALKNVIALAAGISDGLGCGDNARAALMTRGITEMSRLAVAMGAEAATLNGLSGIGDLIVTCSSMLSRNHRAGILIGKGYTMEEAMREVSMVVEGVYSAKAAKALAEKYNVSMPVVEEVNAVLFEGRSAAEALKGLMMRDRKQEQGRN